MKKVINLLCVSFLINICLFPLALHAQENLIIQNQAARYILGSRDELLIKVNILGYIERPGQYLVPQNTDMISLIAFAGGFERGANLKNIHMLRDKTQVEYFSSTDRTNNNGYRDSDISFKINFEDYLSSGGKKTLPTLYPGDTIIVSRTFGQGIKEGLGFISAFAILAQMAFWVSFVITQ